MGAGFVFSATAAQAEPAPNVVMVCSGPRHTVQVSEGNNRLEMSVVDMVNGAELQRNVGVRAIPNDALGGMDYYTTEGGVETRLFVPTRDSNRPCDMYIGNLPMESGNLNIPGLTDTNETLAMCDTPQSAVRVYQDAGRIKMRIYDRQDNMVWLDTSARRDTSGNSVTYTTIRGETSASMTMVNDASAYCSLTIGNSLAQRGVIVVQEQPGTVGGSGYYPGDEGQVGGSGSYPGE